MRGWLGALAIVVLLAAVPVSAEAADTDLDGVTDAVDNCPYSPNPDQADLDADAMGDICDADMDGDGLDIFSDPDTDGDGLDNAYDNCPKVPNADQADLDANGVGDVCEPGASGGGGGVVEDPIPVEPQYLPCPSSTTPFPSLSVVSQKPEPSISVKPPTPTPSPTSTKPTPTPTAGAVSPSPSPSTTSSPSTSSPPAPTVTPTPVATSAKPVPPSASSSRAPTPSVSRPPPPKPQLLLTSGNLDVVTMQRGTTRTIPFTVASRVIATGNVHLVVDDSDGLPVATDPLAVTIPAGMERTYFLTINAPCLDPAEGTFLVTLHAEGTGVKSATESIQVVVHGATAHGAPGVPLVGMLAALVGVVAWRRR